jgi:hypothetical protein
LLLQFKTCEATALANLCFILSIPFEQDTPAEQLREVSETSQVFDQLRRLS